jgi:hypothetical protein
MAKNTYPKPQPVQDRRRRDPMKPLPDFAGTIAACETQEEKERLTNHYLELADAIWELIQLKRANNGIMPDGERRRVAHKYALSEDQVDRLTRRVLFHEKQREQGKPVGPRAQAVMAGTPGRQQGKRNLPVEVEQFITDAWRVSSYASLNRHDEAEQVHVRLTRQEVWQLARKKFPQHEISYDYACRVIHDFIATNRAKSDYARGHSDAVRDNIPAMDADFGDPNNIHIWDVRPLPLRSKHKGVLCTAGLLLGMDASSTKILRHKLLPRKDVSDKGEIFGVDFTTQHVRTQIALAILETKKRPRVIYVDNASIFRKSLQRFLDLLTVEGEPSTEIIYSGVDDPRGRGVLERLLALMDQFARFVPGFFHEDNYRKALKETKKYKFKEFSEIEQEFNHFIPIWNDRSRNGKSSPNTRYGEGPDVGLSPPSALNLALFGGMVKMLDPRIPSRKGVRYNNVHYDLVTTDPEITDKLISASIAKAQIQCLLAQIQELKVIYVRLGDAWEPCLPEGKRNWSGQKQREYKDSMTQFYASEYSATGERLQLALLDDLGRKLVFDRYHHEPVWHDPLAQEGNDNLGSDPAVLSAETSDDKSPGSETAATTTNNGTEPSSTTIIDDDTSDIPNFMRQRMQQLKAQRSQEESR